MTTQLRRTTVRVKPKYRTIVFQLYPTNKQAFELSCCLESVSKFLDISKIEFQKLLYSKGGFLPSRILALLCQRFVGSTYGHKVLPFDEDNSKFVCEDGMWFVDIATKRKGNGKRLRLLISKTDNDYYDCIEDLSTYPFTITEEGGKFFLYASISSQANNINKKIVGVDFNFNHWVASEHVGRPLFFNAIEYSKKVDEVTNEIRLISRQISSDNTMLEGERNELYQNRCAIVKLAHGNFLSGIGKQFGLCTIAIEEIETMYKLVDKESKSVNNWLYSKTALSKFALQAMIKGFEVIEVDPYLTSQICHRCGSKGVVYGKHGRLFKCSNCGLRDFNRDLNASRNISTKGRVEYDRLIKSGLISNTNCN